MNGQRIFLKVNIRELELMLGLIVTTAVVANILDRAFAMIEANRRLRPRFRDGGMPAVVSLAVLEWKHDHGHEAAIETWTDYGYEFGPYYRKGEDPWDCSGQQSHTPNTRQGRLKQRRADARTAKMMLRAGVDDPSLHHVERTMAEAEAEAEAQPPKMVQFVPAPYYGEGWDESTVRAYGMISTHCPQHVGNNDLLKAIVEALGNRWMAEMSADGIPLPLYTALVDCGLLQTVPQDRAADLACAM